MGRIWDHCWIHRSRVCLKDRRPAGGFNEASSRSEEKGGAASERNEAKPSVEIADLKRALAAKTAEAAAKDAQIAQKDQEIARLTEMVHGAMAKRVTLLRRRPDAKAAELRQKFDAALAAKDGKTLLKTLYEIQNLGPEVYPLSAELWLSIKKDWDGGIRWA